MGWMQNAHTGAIAKLAQKAVEAEGWALQHFTVHDGPSGRAEAYCVFRQRR